MRPIDLPPADLETVRRILRAHAPGLEARAFGSRVSWTARETSDLDLVLMTESPLDAGRMAALRAALAGSDLPFRVDVADWAAVSEDFRAIIEREYVVLRRKTPAGPTRKTERRLRKFGDCAELVRNAVSPASMEDTPYIGLEHIGEGTLSILGRGTIRDVNSPKYEFQSGDILFGKLRPYFRKVVRPNFDGVCSTDIWVVRAKKNIDRIFLYYTMANPLFVDFATNASEGTKMPRAKWDWVSRYEVRLPPLAEQRAIADVLGALDDKIELNRRMNETLEATARAIFDDWFIDFGPTCAKMEGREPYLAPEVWRLFPDRIDADTGAPEGWRPGSLGDIAVSEHRAVAPAEVAADTPYIGLEHMPRRSIALSRWDRADQVTSQKARFKAGEFLFGKLNPHFHKIGVAPLDGICSTDIVVIRPVAEEWSALALACISTDRFVDYANRHSTGTGLPRTNWRALSRYELAIPPAALAAAYGDAIVPMLDRIVANVRESHALAHARDALLPRLMSGRLRLGDAEKAVA